MNIYQIFTPSGLTAALHAHHKNLHANYNFPPLKGRKAEHRLADVFMLSGAEQLANRLDDAWYKMTSSTLSLTDSGVSQNVHVEIYLEDEFEEARYQLRVMRENEPTLMICDVDPSHMSPPSVQYRSPSNVSLYYGGYALTLNVEDNVFTATLFDIEKNSTFSINEPPKDNKKSSVFDEVSESWCDVNQYGFHVPHATEQYLDAMFIVKHRGGAFYSGSPYGPEHWENHIHEALTLRRQDAYAVAEQKGLPRLIGVRDLPALDDVEIKSLKDVSPGLYRILSMLASSLTAAQVEVKVSDMVHALGKGESPAEHLYWSRSDWSTEVANGDTKLSYADWICHRAIEWAQEHSVPNI